MLKNTEDDNFGNDQDCQLVKRPQLVRHATDSDKEDEKFVTSSKLLGELRRLSTSYHPDVKSELDRLVGVNPKDQQLQKS